MRLFTQVSRTELEKRIVSMDQFRGYAILAMIFVNFVGGFDITPWLLKHHRTGMSYNDTIAPIFVFVVGMGMRLSWLKRSARDGARLARHVAAKRYILLTIIGFVIYAGYLWDALTDIGIAGLLSLPFIDRGPAARTATALIFLTLYQAIYSLTGYGDWVLEHSLNGGPCGPLSWGFILICGTLAYDLMKEGKSYQIVVVCLLAGLALCAAGWTLKLEWPGIKAAWPFSQYGMSAPYSLYATGLCFLTLLVFHGLCDRAGFQFPHLTILGANPLLMYLMQAALILLASQTLPDSASCWSIAAGFCAIYALCYGCARWLHARHLILKL